MIFPLEIIELIICFSHPVEIANYGLVCREWYNIAMKIQFSPKNNNHVKSNHLLSLWYFLLNYNNRNKYRFDSQTDYSIVSSHLGVIKIYYNNIHVCVEMFKYLKVFNRQTKHPITKIHYLMINETMYIILVNSMTIKRYFDIIQVVHSYDCPISKRVKYLSRKFSFCDPSSGKTNDLKTRLISYYYHKNLYELADKLIVVHKNSIIYAKKGNMGVEFFLIDINTSQHTPLTLKEYVPLDYHLLLQPCDSLTNLACTIHSVVHTVPREPHSVVLFAQTNGHPYSVRPILPLDFTPRTWMSFCNDPENYILYEDQFYKVL